MLGYGGLVLEQVQAAHMGLRGATLLGQGSSLPFVTSWICSVPPVPLHVCHGSGCPCVWVMALHVCQWWLHMYVGDGSLCTSGDRIWSTSIPVGLEDARQKC